MWEDALTRLSFDPAEPTRRVETFVDMLVAAEDTEKYTQHIPRQNRFVNGFAASNVAKRFATPRPGLTEVDTRTSKTSSIGKKSFLLNLFQPATNKCGGCQVVLLGSKLTMLTKQQAGCFRSRPTG